VIEAIRSGDLAVEEGRPAHVIAWHRDDRFDGRRAAARGARLARSPVPAGAWFLLDIYATNHDPRIWTDPAAFRPGRFASWDGDPYAFVPRVAASSREATAAPGSGPRSP
jgi:cytochrome P450